MKLFRTQAPILCLTTLLAGCTGSSPSTTTTTAATTVTATIPNLQPFTDNSGTLATYATAGVIDETGPFFQTLGTNGRTCASCHQASQAMSSPAPAAPTRSSTPSTARTAPASPSAIWPATA
jgi:hypothetical protein